MNNADFVSRNVIFMNVPRSFVDCCFFYYESTDCQILQSPASERCPLMTGKKSNDIIMNNTKKLDEESSLLPFNQGGLSNMLLKKYVLSSNPLF
jgi:hypothetical protein